MIGLESNKNCLQGVDFVDNVVLMLMLDAHATYDSHSTPGSKVPLVMSLRFYCKINFSGELGLRNSGLL